MTPKPTAKNPPKSKAAGLAGVDLASFQGEPAQWRAEAGAVRWVAVKITEVSVNADGTLNLYVNPDAADDWAYAKAQGYARVAYLFGHPKAPVDVTVTAFCEQLAQLVLDDGDAVCLDWETNDDPGSPLGPGGVTPEAGSKWAADVAEGIGQRTSRTSLLYTFLAFAEAGYCTGLGHLPLWMSDPSSPEGKPRVPAPWTTWVIHQYATTGAIDRDLAKYQTVTAMQKALGKHPPKPQEDTLQLIHQVTITKPVPVPANRRAVTLVWAAVGKTPNVLGPGGMGAEPGALPVAICSADLHIEDGRQIRVTLAEISSDGKTTQVTEAGYSPDGGWTPFSFLFTPKAGSSYEIRVTNFGTRAAIVAGGTWLIAK